MTEEEKRAEQEKRHRDFEINARRMSWPAASNKPQEPVKEAMQDVESSAGSTPVTTSWKDSELEEVNKAAHIRGGNRSKFIRDAALKAARETNFNIDTGKNGRLPSRH